MDYSTDLYNFKASQLRRARFKAARCYAQQDVLKLAHLGDSTGRGAPHTTAYKDSPLMVAKSMLAKAGYVSRGTGLIPSFMNYATSEPRVTWYNGQEVYHPFSNLTVNWTTTNGIIFSSYNTGETGNAIDVWFADTSAAFDVQIDKGTKQTICPGGTKTMQYRSFPVPNGTHEVIVVPRTAGAAPFILGVNIRTDMKYGVETYNACISGAKTDSIASTDWCHVASTVSSQSAGWGADLVVVTCLTNDVGNNTPVADFKANLQKAIDNVRNNDADVLLTTGNVHQTLDFSAYVTAAYELADSNNLPLLDTQARWGTWAEANSYGAMNDQAHPSVIGYGDLGRALYKALPL